jgi:hypothetical protein
MDCCTLCFFHITLVLYLSGIPTTLNSYITYNSHFDWCTSGSFIVLRILRQLSSLPRVISLGGRSRDILLLSSGHTKCHRIIPIKIFNC